MPAINHNLISWKLSDATIGPQAKIQAEIKAKAAVECPLMKPQNALTRMQRKKDTFCISTVVMAKGATNNTKSLDMRYGYL